MFECQLLEQDCFVSWAAYVAEVAYKYKASDLHRRKNS